MKNSIMTNPDVEKVFEGYPKHIKPKILFLREQILETARQANVEELQETLKWGEPSYLSKKGSTIRIDWKEKSPDQFAMYFKCTSKLVPAFRRLFKGKLRFENNRAIIFNINDKIPVKELRECIKAALMYHEVKNDKDLGIVH